MGRRRRKVVRIVKRTIPKIFTCPSCGEETVRVELSRGSRQAVVRCSGCGLKGEYAVAPADQIVDIYCKFTDNYYSSGKGGMATAQVGVTSESPVEESELDEEENIQLEETDPPAEPDEESDFELFPKDDDSVEDAVDEASDEKT